MDNGELLKMAQQWANDVLLWVGFGTIVGLLAKAIMPGRDPGGTVATLCMGIAGSVIGCGMVAFLYRDQRITPISPLGFAVATGGAFVILLFYRLLGGYWFVEGGSQREVRYVRRIPPVPRRRQAVDVVRYDD